jgi:hypothetical protein
MNHLRYDWSKFKDYYTNLKNNKRIYPYITYELKQKIINNVIVIPFGKFENSSLYLQKHWNSSNYIFKSDNINLQPRYTI